MQASEKFMKEKIERYENYLNEVLRKDLEKCLEARDKIYTEQADYLALRTSILTIRDSGLKKHEPLNTKVDLGCNFYCQAEIANPDRIMVAVGLGYFLDMSLEEALQFVNTKDKELSDRAEQLTKTSVKIKAEIKLMICGLKELQNVSVEDGRAKHRDIFA